MSAPVTLYHGTTWEVSELIETEGLRTVRPMASNYATTDIAEADRYAVQVAELRGDMPVVVELRVPADEFDEKWSPGIAPSHFQTWEPVPASYVVAVVEAEVAL